MFELNHNMKDNAAKIFSELILAKYDESFLLTVLEDMKDDNDYLYDVIDINGTPVECCMNIVHTLSYEEFEDGTTVDRKIVIVVTADEKAVLVDMTMTDKLASNNGVLDIESSGAVAHEISIAEALELWKD